MLQIAGGILIAALVLGIVAFGLNIALDRDLRTLGESGRGWWIAAIGVGAALAIIIYGALA